MGCDIHGFLEVKEDTTWLAVSNIGQILDRNYAMFGLLFGVRNYNRYLPVADQRGIPDDASEIVKDCSNWVDAHSHSWISYSEIAAIDWEHGKGTALCDRTSVYRKGEEKPFMHFLWSSDITEQERLALGGGETIEKIDSLLKVPCLYRREIQTYQEALSSDWTALFESMKILAEHHGAEHVRLAVWFDN